MANNLRRLGKLMLAEIVSMPIERWVAVLISLALYLSYKHNAEAFVSSLWYVVPLLLVVVVIGTAIKNFGLHRSPAFRKILIGLSLLIGILGLLVWSILRVVLPPLKGWLSTLSWKVWLAIAVILTLWIGWRILRSILRVAPEEIALVVARDGDNEQSWSDWFWSWFPLSKNSLWLTTGWTLFVIGIGLIAGDWWWDMVKSWLGVIVIVGLITYGCMTRSEPGKYFRWTLAQMGIYLFIVAIIWNIPWVKTKRGELYASMSSDSSVGTPSKVNQTSDDREITQIRTDTLFHANLPYEDAREMVDIIACESGFHHTVDGKNVLTNGTAVGVAQIKTDVWGPKAQELGLDLYDRDDNLSMALAIRKDPKSRGAAEWECFDKVKNKEKYVETIVAPVGKWSDPVPVGRNCSGISNGLVKVRDSRGNVYNLSPSETHTIVTTTFEYMTPSGDPKTVTRTGDCR